VTLQHPSSSPICFKLLVNFQDWTLPAANPTAIDERRASFDEQEFSGPEIDRRRRVDPVTDFALIRT
jgi:hypothetical protein